MDSLLKVQQVIAKIGTVVKSIVFLTLKMKGENAVKISERPPY